MCWEQNKWFCMSPDLTRQVVCSALPWVLFSRAEKAHVGKFQGGLTNGPVEASTCCPSCEHSRINHSSPGTVFQSNLGTQRCLNYTLLSGLFHQAVEQQTSCFRNMFISSVYLPFGVCWYFVWRGKSLIDFEEHNVESTCHLGFLGCLLFVCFT